MDTIVSDIDSSVKNWKNLANEIGIPRSEQELMRKAFM
jgi:serine/threonine-protein kinase HipA